MQLKCITCHKKNYKNVYNNFTWWHMWLSMQEYFTNRYKLLKLLFCFLFFKLMLQQTTTYSCNLPVWDYRRKWAGSQIWFRASLRDLFILYLIRDMNTFNKLKDLNSTKKKKKRLVVLIGVLKQYNLPLSPFLFKKETLKIGCFYTMWAEHFYLQNLYPLTLIQQMKTINMPILTTH